MENLGKGDLELRYEVRGKGKLQLCYIKFKMPILENRDITLTKVCIVKTMGFPVVMYGCESWTIKKAEHRRTDPFELWC